MQTKQISDAAVLAIKKSPKLMGRLMGFANRGQNTIENWINAVPRDMRLTTPDAVQIIAEETGLSEQEILEPVTETEKVGG